MASKFRERATRFAKRFLIAFIVLFTASAAVVALFFFGPTTGKRYRTPEPCEEFFPGLVLYPARDDLVATMPEYYSGFSESLPPLPIDFAFICTTVTHTQNTRLSFIDGRVLSPFGMAPWVSSDDVVIDVAPERAEALLSRMNSLTRDRLGEYGISTPDRETHVDRTTLPDGATQYRTETILYGGYVKYRADYEVREGKAYLSSWSYHTYRSISNASKLWAAGILSVIIALLFATGSFGSKHRTFRLTQRSE